MPVKIRTIRRLINVFIVILLLLMATNIAAMFYVIDKNIGLRVAPNVEKNGIDLHYHGVQSYPEFDTVQLPDSEAGEAWAPAKPGGAMATD